MTALKKRSIPFKQGLVGYLLAVLLVSSAHGRREEEATLRGRIVSKKTGEAYVAATVTLSEKSWFGGWSQTVITGMDGTYSFDGLAAGLYAVEVYATGLQRYAMERRIEPGERAVQDFVLEEKSPRAILSSLLLGRIVSTSTLSPIEGARVTIGDTLTVVSDNNGYFSVAGPQAGTTVIRVSREHYLPFVDTVEIVRRGVLSVEIPLRTSLDVAPTLALLKGVVRDPSGAMVPGARIEIGGGGPALIADSSGAFKATMDPGAYTVVVAHPEWDPWVGSVLLEAGHKTDVAIGLEPRDTTLCDPGIGVIAGSVTGETGAPAGGSAVLIEETGDYAAANDEGVFRMDSIPEGRFTLLAVLDGYEPVRKQVDVWAGTVASVSLALADTSRPESIREDDSQIRGKIVEASTQKPIAGAHVRVEGSEVVSMSGHAGDYLLAGVKPGTRVLTVSHGSFVTARKNARVPDSGSVTVDFLLNKSDGIRMQTIVVRAPSIKSSEAALLRERIEAPAISDAIGADEMSRVNASSAADAMARVTGVTVVDGKYVIVRGLGDRYNTTLLNGVTLPSADPEKRAVQFDLFPTGLLENINTLKTFTPDLPGGWVGGCVDIRTKDFPEEPELTLSAKIGLREGITFSDDFLVDEGGKTDWLGFDDGSRAIPEELDDRYVWVPSRYDWLWKADTIEGYTMQEWSDHVLKQADKTAKAFDSDFEPTATTARPAQGYALSLGNTIEVLDRPFGFFGSLSYSNKLGGYRDGEFVQWRLNGEESETPRLDSLMVKREDMYKTEVLWGGLVNAGYELADEQRISGLFMYTRHAESKAARLETEYHENLTDGSDFQQNEIRYRERGLSFSLLEGEHALRPVPDFTLAWKLAQNGTIQNEPDHRRFTNVRTITTDSTGMSDTTYDMRTSVGTEPEHSYYFIEEKGNQVRIDLEKELPSWTSKRFVLKGGYSYERRSRTYSQRKYNIKGGGASADIDSLNRDVKAFTANDNMGLVHYDTLPGGYIDYQYMGNMIAYSPADTVPNHDAHQSHHAFYLMWEMPLMEQVRLVQGLRYEQVRMRISSWATYDTIYAGGFEGRDFLPSTAVIYSPLSTVNIRGGYSWTVARPTFREMALYESYTLGSETSFHGNPNLKPTRVNNFDLRFEYLFSPGELVGLSLFYKKMYDPIDYLFLPGDNNQMTVDNMDSADVWGAELEVRKDFGFIAPPLRGLRAALNLTLLKTEISVDSSKADELKARRVDPTLTRPMGDASPYVVNAGIQYDNDELGISSNVYFNVFGRRLSFVMPDATPDCYEYPRPDLGVSVSKKLVGGLKMKVSAKNLLDPAIATGHEYKDNDFYRVRYTKGRSYSLSLTYTFH